MALLFGVLDTSDVYVSLKINDQSYYEHKFCNDKVNQDGSRQGYAMLAGDSLLCRKRREIC